MDDSRRCSGCGAANPAAASWCGQCFAQLAPAGAPERAVAWAGPPGGPSAASAALMGPQNSVGFAGGHRRSFGERLHVGFRLVAIGFRTAWDDPRLLAAPFLSALATLLVVGVVAVVTRTSPLALFDTEALTGAGWLALGVIVYCGTVFAILAEAFVVAAASLRFEGRPARTREVWVEVGPRLGALALWALVQMIVTTVLSAMRGRAGNGRLGGRVAARAAETAWATLTILVVPVILYERAGAFEAMRRSTQLFRQVWGQTLAGGFGLGIALSALGLAAVLVAAPLALLDVGVAVAVGVLLLVLVQLVGSVAGGALTAALYRYAATGALPGEYGPQELAVRR